MHPKENSTFLSDLGAVHVPDVLFLNPLVIFYLVVEGCIMLPIIAGNSLIVISVSKFHFLRKPCNILIASLALSDLLVGMVAIPFDFAFYLSYSLKRMRYPCLFRHFIWIVCLGSSIANLLLIAVERFLAVDFPLKHQISKTNRKSFVAALFIWMLVFAPCSTVLLGADTWTPRYGCMFHFIFKKPFTLFLSVSLIAEVTLSAVLFVRVIVVTRRRVRLALSTMSAQKEKNERSRSNLLALVYGLFVLFWSPYMLYGFCSTTLGYDLQDKYGKLMVLIGTCNSCVNFFVYGYKKPSFRIAFQKVMRIGSKDQRSADQNQSSSTSHGHHVSKPSVFQCRL